MVKSTTKTCFPRQPGVILQYRRRNTTISTLHAPGDLIKVIIWRINENKKRKCFKWRTIAVGFKVYGWKNTVSKYWYINPFERILENSSKYFSECKLFGQNYFWKTHPLFFEISIFWSRAKANFWKPDPYLVNRLDEFSRNMSRSWTGFEHNLVVIKLAWMNFPGINLGPEICQ